MWYKPLVVTEFKNTTCLSQVLQGRDSITFPVLSIHIQEGGCDLEPLRHLCSSCWCRWQRWLRGHRYGGQAAVASVSAAPAGGLGHPEASSCILLHLRSCNLSSQPSSCIPQPSILPHLLAGLWIPIPGIAPHET